MTVNPYSDHRLICNITRCRTTLMACTSVDNIYPIYPLYKEPKKNITEWVRHKPDNIKSYNIVNKKGINYLNIVDKEDKSYSYCFLLDKENLNIVASAKKSKPYNRFNKYFMFSKLSFNLTNKNIEKITYITR